jgi:hypothetical protein
MLGLVHVGTDVVDLAVVEASPVDLLQLQDQDVVLLGEGVHLTAQTVADVVEQRRRRDRIAEAPREEPDHPPDHLEVGYVGVHVDPVDPVTSNATCPSSTSLMFTVLAASET